MKKIALLIVILCGLSCSNKVSKKDLNHLNGYWEISEVVFPNGSSKIYNVNTAIDFIEIKDTIGFIKKVQPKFDGTYIVNKDAESFSIVLINDVYNIYYHKEFTDRMEQLLQISEDKYSIKNKDNITYHYKRYIPFNIK